MVVQQALASVHGVDKNPFAVVVCRFRLLMAAIKASGAGRLGESRSCPLSSRSATRSSPVIPHMSRGGIHQTKISATTRNPAINLLGAGSYHVVVGNPPYTTVRDRNEYEIYRAIYPVCRGRYPLTVPFIVRFFKLATSTADRAGFTGILASNAFMKREFGRPLVEEFLPTVELTHVLDTSGAYIPGHSVPTVILLGRARHPRTQAVRAALGVRGEPAQSADPAAGRRLASHHRADRTSRQRERVGARHRYQARPIRDTPLEPRWIGGQQPTDRAGNRNAPEYAHCPHRLLRHDWFG